MKQFEFLGTVIMRNGETKTFDNIVEYNEFIAKNISDIESITSTSQFIDKMEKESCDGETQCIENKKEDRDSIPISSSTNLSQIIKSAFIEAEKYYNYHNNLQNYNDIGDRLEKCINEMSSDIVFDNENVKYIINNKINQYNEYIDKIYKNACDNEEDIKKIESEMNELEFKLTELKSNFDEKQNLKSNLDADLTSARDYYSFIAGVKNMYEQLLNRRASYIPDKNIKCDVSEINPQIETNLSTNFNEIIENFFGKRLDPQFKDLSHDKNLKGISRLIKEIMSNE